MAYAIGKRKSDYVEHYYNHTNYSILYGCKDHNQVEKF